MAPSRKPSPAASWNILCRRAFEEGERAVLILNNDTWDFKGRDRLDAPIAMNIGRLFTFSLQAQFRNPFGAKTHRLRSQVIGDRVTNANGNISMAIAAAICKVLLYSNISSVAFDSKESCE